MLFYVACAVVAVWLYIKLVKPIWIWRDMKIPYVPALPLLGSNLGVILQRESMGEDIGKGYKRFADKRYFGIHTFTLPVLVIRDIDLIKQLCVKDFDSFAEHRTFLKDTDHDPLWARNLVASTEKNWRFLRPTLSPSFTSSKMRMMHQLMDDCARTFVEHFASKPESTISIEAKTTFARVTNDIIATCGFGVTCNSSVDPDNEFYMMGRSLTNLRGFKALKFFMPASVIKFFKITVFERDVQDFFRRLIRETVEYREKHNVFRPDMIELLMQARKGVLEREKEREEEGFAVVEESAHGLKPPPPMKMTLDDMTAQAMIFFFAGYDTTSSLMMMIAYELAINPEIQVRLREEVNAVWKECVREAKEKGTEAKLDYDRLLNMKYLDMVISETLRKWPPTTLTDRHATRDYILRAERPDEHDLHLKRETVLFVPQFSVHRDERYWPNPERFDPERFSEENKHKVIPHAFMPFGIGPRNCIGSRFALLENKTVFFHMLRRFEFVPIEKTPVPFVQDPKEFGSYPKGGMWVGLKKIVS